MTPVVTLDGSVSVWLDFKHQEGRNAGKLPADCHPTCTQMHVCCVFCQSRGVQSYCGERFVNVEVRSNCTKWVGGGGTKQVKIGGLEKKKREWKHTIR